MSEQDPPAEEEQKTGPGENAPMPISGSLFPKPARQPIPDERVEVLEDHMQYGLPPGEQTWLPAKVLAQDGDFLDLEVLAPDGSTGRRSQVPKGCWR